MKNFSIKQDIIRFKNFYERETVLPIIIIEHETRNDFPEKILFATEYGGYLHGRDNNTLQDEIEYNKVIIKKIEENIEKNKNTSFLNFEGLNKIMNFNGYEDDDQIKLMIETAKYWTDNRIFEKGSLFSYCYDVYDTNKLLTTMIEYVRDNYFKKTIEWGETYKEQFNMTEQEYNSIILKEKLDKELQEKNKNKGINKI